MWGKVSQSSISNSQSVLLFSHHWNQDKERGIKPSNSSEQQGNISPLFTARLESWEPAPDSKSSEEENKSNKEVKNRANLFYLAQLNRNNPTKLTSCSCFCSAELRKGDLNKELPKERLYLAELNRNNPTKLTRSCSCYGESGDLDEFPKGLELKKREEGTVSEFARSFYESSDNPDLEEMRRGRRSTGGSAGSGGRESGAGAKKCIRRSTSPRKTVNRRKGMKRSQSTVNDDSIMIISPMESSHGDWTPHGSTLEGISDSRIQKHKKRIRLFQSSVSRTSHFGLNETIDLVEEEDHESNDSEDVVILDNDGMMSNENEDIEIVGIRIVSPNSRSPCNTTQQPWIKHGSRNSNKNNLSFKNVQQAVRRAKQRFSSPSNVTKILAASRNIKKKKKKKQKSPFLSNAAGRGQNQQQYPLSPNHNRSGRNRMLSYPVYKLDNEIGPRNPAWNMKRPPPKAAEFIPISLVSSGPVASAVSSTASSQLEANVYLSNGASVEPPSFEAFNLMCVPGSTPRLCIPGTPRPIVIDASNVAMAHGNGNVFSCKGIKICVDYFRSRGHKEIIAFVPRFRCKSSEAIHREILQQLHDEGVLKYTASREVGGQRISSYDDRYIVQYAAEVQGIIISNDNYKDIYDQQIGWRNQIAERLLQFTWIGPECIMFPWDPLGRHGPSLDKFLRY